MSLACIILAMMLGQVASVEDIVAQMQAQDDQIQTLEFLFHLEQVKGPGYFESAEKVEKTQTRGRLLYRAPHQVKLERLSESGDVLEARAISADGAEMKGFSFRPEIGSTDGFVARTAFEFYFDGVPGLFRHSQFESFRLQLLSPQVKNDCQVATLGNLLRLSRSSVQFDVDPARGYWVVSLTSQLPHRNVSRRVSTAPVEFSSGVWIAKSSEVAQKRNGKVFYKLTATVDLDSVRLNQPIDARAFEIVLPTGTRVDDLIRNKSEFVGGQNSRDRKSVEQLAAAANNQPTPVAPTKDDLIPISSALRVPETSFTSFWNRGALAIVVSSLLVLCGGWFSWQRWWRS